MSDVDGILRTFVLNVIFPISILILILLLIKKPLRYLHVKIYTHVVSGALISNVNRHIGHEKELLFEPLRSLKRQGGGLTLLEVGPGGGANFKFYPKGTDIICVDSNPIFQSYLEKRVANFPDVNLKQFIVGKGEDMSDINDACCEAVVCTMVLCSTEDVDGLLKEVLRVLKPCGMFFYVEHVAAKEDTWLYSFQCYLNPAWKIFALGCHLNRRTWTNIDRAGFSEVEYRRLYVDSWNLPLRYVLMGTATK